jgi:hypothetical protein
MHFAELLLLQTIYRKNSDISQLDTIFLLFGTPKRNQLAGTTKASSCAPEGCRDETTAIPFDEIHGGTQDAISAAAINPLYWIQMRLDARSL